MTEEEVTAERPLRLLVTVTFNPNQLKSHLLPLIALPEVESVTLVADVAPPPLPKLRAVVPPRWLVRLAGRAGAKLVVCLLQAARERPDWIVGFNFVPHGFNTRAVGALTRTRSLYHMIGGDREWRGGGWSSENGVLGRLPFPVPPLERLLLRLIAGCTHTITMGDRGRRTLIERGVEASRVTAIPPSIDTRRFRPAARATIDFDVITVSRLTENKRTEDIIHAVAAIRRRGYPITLAVVGHGPLDQALRTVTEDLEIDDAVTYLGFQEALEALYQRSRLFALASRSEGLPITMLEAMASGLPVVVTRVGEIPDVVRDGVNGYTFEPGDVESLASHLERLVVDDELCGRLAASAATDAAALASVAAVARRYSVVLRGGRERDTGTAVERDGLTVAGTR